MKIEYVSADKTPYPLFPGFCAVPVALARIIAMLRDMDWKKNEGVAGEADDDFCKPDSNWGRECLGYRRMAKGELLAGKTA